MRWRPQPDLTRPDLARAWRRASGLWPERRPLEQLQRRGAKLVEGIVISSCSANAYVAYFCGQGSEMECEVSQPLTL